MSTVSLAIQCRVRPGFEAAYRDAQEQVGKLLRSKGGFLSQEIVPPTEHVPDWLVVQKFADERSAKDWVRSPDLARLLKEIAPLLVGHDTITLLHGASQSKEHVSATVTCQVPADKERQFLDWQRRIFAAEAAFPGFVSHRLERPVPGVQDHWSIVLTFDTDEHMDRWLESEERNELLVEAKGLQTDLAVRRSSYGFEFWSQDKQEEGTPSVFKSNLLVLLVLYPIVFLWGTFVSKPYIEDQGVPFWAALFIGNLVSTQLLGWWVVPWTFKAFDKWLKPHPSPVTNALGYGIILALYALSMAFYAYLLTRF